MDPEKMYENAYPENLGPVLAHTVVCPDGTQYQVYADGSWIHESWDGAFVRDETDASTTPAEVLAKLAEPGPAPLMGGVRHIVAPDGTQFAVYDDGTWGRYTWDGQFVTNGYDTGTDPAEVRTKLGL